MNILTKNRILQEGDEVWAGSGEWEPIPSSEYGLQIEFSKYAKRQIRRPSEPEQNGAEGTPVPPNVTPADQRRVAAPAPPPKVEGKPSVPPLPTPKPLSETYGKAKPKANLRVLPTVVSKKAHEIIKAAAKAAAKEIVHGMPLPVIHGISTKETIKAVTKPRRGMVSDEISIPFSDLSAMPEWIGRNGRFNAKGIRLNAVANGLIQIRPEGARGLAKNALIEFPAADIPKVIDWLLRHQVTPSTHKALYA